MGMFDDIKCKYPLPKTKINEFSELKSYDFQKESYQTKDLDNCLCLFEIREDGTIWKHRQETEWEPGNENGDWLERLGKIKVLREWWEQAFPHGDIYFYTAIHENVNENDYWIEFVATFDRGSLASIKEFEVTATNNAERKQRDKEFQIKLRKNAEFRKKFLVKYLYIPYSKLIVKIFRQLRKINLWKIERFLTPF